MATFTTDLSDVPFMHITTDECGYEKNGGKGGTFFYEVPNVFKQEIKAWGLTQSSDDFYGFQNIDVFLVSCQTNVKMMFQFNVYGRGDSHFPGKMVFEYTPTSTEKNRNMDAKFIKLKFIVSR